MAKKKTSSIKDTKFTILRKNWSNNENTFFIYSVSPEINHQPNSGFRRDPKYHTVSLFTETEYDIGTKLHADVIEYYDSSKNSYHYELGHVIYDWPTSPSEQWDFLDRFTRNANFRQIYSVLSEKMKFDTNVLDIITSKEFKVDTLDLDAKKQSRWNNFIEQINKYKSASAFLNALPSEVAELLSDAESNAISKLVDGSAERSAQTFLDNPYAAMKLKGIGFKKVDSIRDRLENLFPENFKYNKHNDERLFYGAYYILSEIVFKAGSTYIEEDEFKKIMIKELMIEENDYETFMLLKPKYDSNFSIVDIDGKISTLDMYQAESKIFDRLAHGYKNKPIDNKLNDKLTSFLENSSSQMTDEQIAIFNNVLTNQFNLLVGPGGVGKTWTVGNLIKFLNTNLHWNVVLAAPTGKAAQVLSGYTGYSASTLHRTFGITESGHSITVKCDLLVIDEFSMVDSQLLSNVLNGLELQDTKILFVGDESQLPSVGAGNVLHSFIENKIITVSKLTKVFRTKDSLGGITQLSTMLREGNVNLKNNQNKMYAIGKDLAVQNISSEDLLSKRVLYIYNHMISQNIDPSDIMVLTPRNAGLTGQAQLNVHIQNILRKNYGLLTTEELKKENQTDVFDFDNTPDIEKENISFSRTIHGVETHFYLNDLIMFNSNRTYGKGIDPDDPIILQDDDAEEDSAEKSQIYNGDTGKIIDISETSMIVEVVGQEDYLQIGSEDINEISLAYAMTIHKSQGSQALYGILAFSNKDYYMLNSNLLYTGVSRFKERLYLVGSLSTLKTKSKVFINQNRKTFLSIPEIF